MVKKPQPNEEARFWHQIVDSLTKIVITAIKYGTVIACVFLIYKSVEVLAGQETQADINFKASGDLSINQSSNPTKTKVKSSSMGGVFSWLPGVLGLIVGASGIGYGRAQEKLRKDVVQEFAEVKRRRELERDPGRTSSLLTVRGDTNPEDK